MLLGEKLTINKLLQTIFKKYDSYAGYAFFEKINSSSMSTKNTKIWSLYVDNHYYWRFIFFAITLAAYSRSKIFSISFFK